MLKNSFDRIVSQMPPAFVKIGDPRRESLERSFKLNPPSEEDIDYYALLALMFGLLGLFLKYRIFVWQAVVCCVISFANMKNADIDTKQLLSSFSLSIMGLVMAYFGPQARFFQ